MTLMNNVTCTTKPPWRGTVEKCRFAVTVQPLRFKNSAQAAEIFRWIWPSLACQRLMAYNSASAHHSYTIRILAVCTFSHLVLFFGKKKVHVPLASRLHTSCAKLGLCHMAVQFTKFKFRQYLFIAVFHHFAKSLITLSSECSISCFSHLRCLEWCHKIHNYSARNVHPLNDRNIS